MSWEITFDSTDLDAVLRDVPRLAIEALNRTVDFAADLLLSKVTEIYNVPPGVLSKKFMKVVKANNSPEAEIIIWGKSTPIIHFGAIQTASGVQFQIRKGTIKSIPSAFIATMPSGHKGVFRRTGRFNFPAIGRYASSVTEREIIQEKYSLSLASMISSNSVVDQIMDEVQNYFNEALSDLIDQKLERIAA